MDENKIKFGYFNSTRNSLLEIAKYLTEVLNRIDQESGLNEQDHRFLTLFSSRGSFPFLKALMFISEQQLREGFTPELIPHVYSIENLMEILSFKGKNTGTLHYNTRKPILDVIYRDIANSLTEKISAISTDEKPAILSEWDEVVTGANIGERIKIYNTLDLPPDLQFYIVSFIAEKRRKLQGSNIKGFKKQFKKSPKNYVTLDVLLTNPIGWSDNEDFFGELGLEYPGIAAPNFEFVYNTVKKEHLPEFFLAYFKNYNQMLARNCGAGEENLMYKLLEGDVKKFFDEYLILITSEQALIQTYSQMEGRKLKAEARLLDSRRDIYPETGEVILTGKKDKIILERYDDRFRSTFRNPFALIYDPTSADNHIFAKLVQNYLEAVRLYAKQKSTLTPTKVFG